ncbi:MAG: hypothetical protein ACK5HT_12640 [Draconibacterium sp.]
MKMIMFISICLFSISKISSQNVYNKVFVIGNSLTIGFGTHGMASSNVQTDYYYRVQQALLSTNQELQMTRMNGSFWESGSDGINDGQSSVRECFLDNSVKRNIDGTEDLIIIQLGDNVNSVDKRTTFKEDIVTMINWFLEHCKKARIIWVYGWYEVSSNMPLLEKAISATGKCELVNISRYNTDDKYKSAIGNKYSNDEGDIETIISEGVASHPGDLGMEIIANEINNNINNR